MQEKYNNLQENGNYGKIEIGNYTAELDFASTFDEAQNIIDLENKAAFYNRGGEGMIADHNYQGASEIINNDILILTLPNGEIKEYEKVEQLISDSKTWYVDDKDMLFYRQDCLLFQTCYEKGLVFVFFIPTN